MSDITKAQTILQQAHHIVFMTGAGVSTPSGIPDYRSKNGLYTGHHNAEYYLSHAFLAEHPLEFYQYLKANLYYPDARPNVIHQKMAALTQQGRASVITQNIDNLYNVAQTEQLVEFHGNLYQIYCTKCGQHVDWHDYLQSPYHQTDHGYLRPNVVLYDEGLASANIGRAVQYLQQADLVVICGTSFRVYPFAGLIDYRNPKADVLAINEESLQLPFAFTMVQQNAVDFFKEVQV
ncbi:NAD-dependent protein deacylase [Lactiplantibacillus paraplantarum]|uniref:NAD-dependent protein deacylase n=1 Tax=Lactiplantibacillus paraplantarum TaxID=60520 RepID=UPI0021A2F3CB|nr:NAD-dependent protein deacylase [Lactiplantibacillus paraplantarum]MCT4457022.1 NAD-dependent protein deacylase [Lactiplantibacillus paraplantarum]